MVIQRKTLWRSKRTYTDLTYVYLKRLEIVFQGMLRVAAGRCVKEIMMMNGTYVNKKNRQKEDGTYDYTLSLLRPDLSLFTHPDHDDPLPPDG